MGEILFGAVCRAEYILDIGLVVQFYASKYDSQEVDARENTQDKAHNIRICFIIVQVFWFRSSGLHRS